MGGMNADKYMGRRIFVDFISSFLYVEHQLGFSGSETIKAKKNFEKSSLGHGVIVDSYNVDNEVFKSNAFVSHIREHNQKLCYCGVNAQHKNREAERAIRTLYECTRAQILHTVTSELCHMAADFAV